jgi:hypothetical protein
MRLMHYYPKLTTCKTLDSASLLPAVNDTYQHVTQHVLGCVPAVAYIEQRNAMPWTYVHPPEGALGQQRATNMRS